MDSRRPVAQAIAEQMAKAGELSSPAEVSLCGSLQTATRSAIADPAGCRSAKRERRGHTADSATLRKALTTWMGHGRLRRDCSGIAAWLVILRCAGNEDHRNRAEMAPGIRDGLGAGAVDDPYI